jgi:hypothetical protein
MLDTVLNENLPIAREAIYKAINGISNMRVPKDAYNDSEGTG